MDEPQGKGVAQFKKLLGPLWDTLVLSILRKILVGYLHMWLVIKYSPTRLYQFLAILECAGTIRLGQGRSESTVLPQPSNWDT